MTLFRTFIVVAIAIGIAGAPMAGMTQGTGARTGVFPDVDRMEAVLEKGVSTAADVEALLGPPTGRGGALSSEQPGRPRDIWVYGEIGWSLIELEGSTARLHLDQQLLLVYFVDGRFDGFWWHGNAGAMTGRTGS